MPSQAFVAAMNAAEEAAVSPEDRLNTEPVPTDNETIESVQAATDTVDNSISEQPEDTVEAAAPEESAPAALLAGRFKSVEELERGYTEALKMIPDTAEARASVKEQLAELQQHYEARLAQVEQQQRHVQITPDLINDDPESATEIAWEQRDEATLRRAYSAWEDEDPASAKSWALTKDFERREATLRAELDQVRQQVAQTAAPVQQQQDMLVWQEAWALAAQQDPEIRGQAEAILNDVAPAYAHVFAPALGGDARTRADALVALAQIARGRNADNLKSAVTEAAAETAREAQQARQDAYVATQETAGVDATNVSPEEAEKRRLVERYGRNRGDWWSTH